MQVSQDQNREKGESRTQAFLADDFWVLKRSVDIAGADFLVQQPCFQLEEVHKRKEEIQSLGIVQAKFFQDNKTSVSIKKDYVVYDGKVVNEFFAMLHTGNGDERSHYFFTAEEIVNEFRLDKDEEHYVFRITKKKCFSDYKNRSHKEIVDKINTGIQFSSRVNNAKFIERIYRIYRIPTQHNLSEPEFIYKLRREEEHAFVLVHNVKPGHTERHLLEYRRDLFVNLGSFEWGYIGDGSYFLATCILAHHLNGAKPAVSSVKKLQIYLSDLERDQTHDVTTQTIELVLDS